MGAVAVAVEECHQSKRIRKVLWPLVSYVMEEGRCGIWLLSVSVGYGVSASDQCWCGFDLVDKGGIEDLLWLDKHRGVDSTGGAIAASQRSMASSGFIAIWEVVGCL